MGPCAQLPEYRIANRIVIVALAHDAGCSFLTFLIRYFDAFVACDASDVVAEHFPDDLLQVVFVLREQDRIEDRIEAGDVDLGDHRDVQVIPVQVLP